MTKKSRLFIALLSIGIPAFDCFSSNNVLLKFSTARVKNDDGQLTVMHASKDSISRSSFLTCLSTVLIQSPALVSNALENEISDTASISEDLTPQSKRRTFEGCPKPTPGKPNNCVATANIKQLDTYIPPWTFEVSPEMAFARLKSLIQDEPSYSVVECDESAFYLKVDVKRSFSAEDVMEFMVRGDDRVVVLKSYEKDMGSISDFGANRKRVDDLLQKSSDVFSVMGGGLTADSYDGGAGGKRNGAFGQLKAFYGLQSGQGFQEVLQD